MGLFNKFKKENKKEKQTDESMPENIVKTPNIRKDDEIIDEQLRSELSSLENEINEKNERLRSIVEKIQLSKDEDDEIIKKLIQSKKELRAGNTQTKIMQNSSNSDVTKEIIASKNELKKIQDEIEKKKKLNEELEAKIKKNEPVFSDSEKQKKKIDEELVQRQKELEILKKKLAGMKKGELKVAEDDSKNVVEAASQIVATTNKRLRDTMKELDVTRKLLDKEKVEFRVGTAGGGNQARQPYLEKYDFKICDNLDNANHVHDYGLYVGNHPELKKEQIIDLCRKLNNV